MDDVATRPLTGSVHSTRSVNSPPFSGGDRLSLMVLAGLLLYKEVSRHGREDKRVF